MATSDPIPEELQIDIMTKLPVKSLIRFQSVSKHWESLIRSPMVIKDHLQHSIITNSSLLIRPLIIGDRIVILGKDVESDGTVHVMQNPFPYASAVIVGCCSGTICFTLSHDDTSFAVWNPATRESRWIPHPIIPTFPVPEGDILIRVTLGYSFYPSLTDFKLVRALYFKDKRSGRFSSIRAEVFARNQGHWREIKNLLQESPDLRTVRIGQRFPAANLKGVIYWEGLPMEGPGIPRHLLSFDVNEERFRALPIPDQCKEDAFWKLSVWKEWITLFSHQRDQKEWDVKFDVWRMEEGRNDGQLWTKIFTIGPFREIMLPLAVRYDGKSLMQTSGRQDPGEDYVCFYDLNTGEISYVSFQGARYFYGAYSFAESLVRL